MFRKVSMCVFVCVLGEIILWAVVVVGVVVVLVMVVVGNLVVVYINFVMLIII